MVNYSGPLLAKRKDELAEIARQLDLKLADGVLRPEIIDRIRNELKSNARARQDPRFVGLWTSMRESRRLEGEDTPDPNEQAIDSDDLTEQESSEEEEEEQLPAAAVGSQSQQQHEHQHETSPVTSYRDALLHNKIVDTLLHGQPADLDPHHLVEQALVPASQALVRPARKSFSQIARRGSVSLRYAARETVTIVEDVQGKASQTWVVVAAILAAEMTWLLYESVPWVERHFGPHDWLHRAQTGAFTLRLPALSVVLHPSFIRAIVAWAASTYLLPLVVATLISFPTAGGGRTGSAGGNYGTPSRGGARGRFVANGKGRANGAKGKQHQHLSPPNAVIFTLVRLAIALLKGYILPSSSSLSASASSSVASTASTALRNLGQLLLDATHHQRTTGIVAEIAGWSFAEAVEGVWGVVAVGMGLGAAVGIYAELRR